MTTELDEESGRVLLEVGMLVHDEKRDILWTVTKVESVATVVAHLGYASAEAQLLVRYCPEGWCVYENADVAALLPPASQETER